MSESHIPDFKNREVVSAEQELMPLLDVIKFNGEHVSRTSQLLDSEQHRRRLRG